MKTIKGFNAANILLVGLLFNSLIACRHAVERPWQLRANPFKVMDVNAKRDQQSALRQNVIFHTDTILSAFIEYWPKGNENNTLHSDTSLGGTAHRIVLTHLLPETKYEYRIVLNNGKQYSETQILSFISTYIPVWLDSYYTAKENTLNIDGKIFIYQRRSPGVLVLLNHQGQIEWYTVLNNFVKSACYTPAGTFLAILSDPGFKTAYGNHILEINFKGDTLAHFKTGTHSFDKIFHHEALLDSKGNIVTLTVENIKADLTSVGGLKTDSVMCDGIQIFSKQGKKIWEWTVMDVENPLKDKNILKNKTDWLHANSLCYDSDSNFLISFYNTSQIWKINSKTGERLWIFGENGDFPLSPEASFSGQHTIHIDRKGNLMMFDNGVKTKKSRALSFKLDEQHKTAEIIINATLPDSLYSEKMGSAYLLDDKTILQTSTNKDYILVTDLKGKILKSIKMGGLTYRAQFIPTK